VPNPDLTAELLKQVRDGLHATRADMIQRFNDLDARLDRTDARIDRTRTELLGQIGEVREKIGETNARLGRLEGSVAELVGHVSTLADLDHERGIDLADLRRRMQLLEDRTAT
jgi:uncharacterized coiled-coil DUF342 family protein